MTADAKALAAESWYGYGRWDAPYWFVGMEPGGDDTHASYDAWLDLSESKSGDELIDCRQHHQWQLQKHGIDNPDWTQWHRERPPNKLQATWRPLRWRIKGSRAAARMYASTNVNNGER